MSVSKENRLYVTIAKEAKNKFLLLQDYVTSNEISMSRKEFNTDIIVAGLEQFCIDKGLKIDDILKMGEEQ